MHELRIARSKAGMTLMELEAASGVGASTISKIERGVSQPQANTLHKLAEALGVEVGELYPKAQRTPQPEPEEYADLLEERGFPSEQIAAWMAEDEAQKESIRRELENMSEKEWKEALLRISPRLRKYHRDNTPRKDKDAPPRSESA